MNWKNLKTILIFGNLIISIPSFSFELFEVDLTKFLPIDDVEKVEINDSNTQETKDESNIDETFMESSILERIENFCTATARGCHNIYKSVYKIEEESKPLPIEEAKKLFNCGKNVYTKQINGTEKLLELIAYLKQDELICPQIDYEITLSGKDVDINQLYEDHCHCVLNYKKIYKDSYIAPVSSKVIGNISLDYFLDHLYQNVLTDVRLNLNSNESGEEEAKSCVSEIIEDFKLNARTPDNEHSLCKLGKYAAFTKTEAFRRFIQDYTSTKILSDRPQCPLSKTKLTYRGLPMTEYQTHSFNMQWLCGLSSFNENGEPTYPVEAMAKYLGPKQFIDIGRHAFDKKLYGWEKDPRKLLEYENMACLTIQKLKQDELENKSKKARAISNIEETRDLLDRMPGMGAAFLSDQYSNVLKSESEGKKIVEKILKKNLATPPSESVDSNMIPITQKESSQLEIKQEDLQLGDSKQLKIENLNKQKNEKSKLSKTEALNSDSSEVKNQESKVQITENEQSRLNSGNLSSGEKSFKPNQQYKNSDYWKNQSQQFIEPSRTQVTPRGEISPNYDPLPMPVKSTIPSSDKEYNLADEEKEQDRKLQSKKKKDQWLSDSEIEQIIETLYKIKNPTELSKQKLVALAKIKNDEQRKFLKEEFESIKIEENENKTKIGNKSEEKINPFKSSYLPAEAKPIVSIPRPNLPYEKFSSQSLQSAETQFAQNQKPQQASRNFPDVKIGDDNRQANTPGVPLFYPNISRTIVEKRREMKGGKEIITLTLDTSNTEPIVLEEIKTKGSDYSQLINYITTKGFSLIGVPFKIGEESFVFNNGELCKFFQSEDSNQLDEEKTCEVIEKIELDDSLLGDAKIKQIPEDQKAPQRSPSSLPLRDLKEVDLLFYERFIKFRVDSDSTVPLPNLEN